MREVKTVNETEKHNPWDSTPVRVQMREQGAKKQPRM